MNKTPPITLTWKQFKEIASIDEEKGDFESAEANWMKAVRLLRRDGNDPPNLSLTLERLANALLQNKKPLHAIPALTESLNIKLKALGFQHPAVAQVLNNLAMAYYLTGNYVQAANFGTQCLNSFESIHGPDSEQVSTTALNIATSYQLARKFSEAEPFYTRCIAIRTKIIGATHPQTVKVLKNYASLLREMHRDGEADHLDACVSQSITGSWKALVIAEDSTLAKESACSFCGFPLQGAAKCSHCGTPR